jgi:F-type H+-transporting ATPase subunit b
MMTEQMIAWLDNPYVWSGLALVAFIALLMKLGGRSINQWLDGEIHHIQSELVQAKQLRAEAAELLANYKVREQEAQLEAAALLQKAEREVGFMREAAARELQDNLKRHAQQAAERIARAEAEAIQDVRNAVIQLASAVSADMLAAMRTKPEATAYLDQVIAALPGQLSAKPHA